MLISQKLNCLLQFIFFNQTETNSRGLIDFATVILHILNKIFPSAAQPHLFLPPADPISYPVGRGPPEKKISIMF